jgi:glycosyltransferase involved in cell wall biosynthesis
MKRKIGIYNRHMNAMGGGEKLTLAVAEYLSLQHDVSLFCTEPVDVSRLEEFFAIDLSRVKLVTLTRAGRLPTLVSKLRGNTAAAVVQHDYEQLRQLDLDLFINNSYATGIVCPSERGILMCMFPHANAAREVVESYQTIVAISEYTAEWVQRRWKRSSEIVYPPCDDMGPADNKQKIILHVGRFTADSDQDERHHKGQALLLATFKQMSQLHRTGWELHLVGSVGSEKQFAESLVKEANGLPVVFHFNAAREEVRDLYRKAAIYWHATGYAVDAEQYPGKQEHFGISTVEAMSAGAVPVVYAGGGQKAIVLDGVNGYWWNQLDELVRKTQTLAADDDLRSRMAQHAIHLSKRFSREAFVQQLDQLID